MFPSPPQRIFKETWVWRSVAAIALLLMMGVTWLVYDRSLEQRLDPVLLGLVAFFALLFAFACLWGARRQITIHTEGISYRSLLGEQDLRWEEISETRYGQQPVNAGAHLGLIGLLVMLLAKGKKLRSFQIIGTGTGTINISSNVSGQEDAIRLVLQTVNPRLRQDAERMLSGSGTVTFGNISLAPTGVIWKSKDPIPYSAIAKCRIDDAMLRIKAEGKWLDNIAINAKKVPNVFVLLDMIEARRSSASGQQASAAIAGSSASQYL
ncbi:MAG TPA: DUF6585 family protein [Candidatus Solibacter sp.]|jgi:hypothetical protein|nr:DUF6585 family protein [Candidatus Solibacter sp.]